MIMIWILAALLLIFGSVLADEWTKAARRTRVCRTALPVRVQPLPMANLSRAEYKRILRESGQLRRRW